MQGKASRTMLRETTMPEQEGRQQVRRQHDSRDSEPGADDMRPYAQHADRATIILWGDVSM